MLEEADNSAGISGQESAKKRATESDPLDLVALERAINDAARRANAAWVTLILVMAYLFIATFSVSQSTLFRNAPVKLPIFNADLSLNVYFCIAPALVLIVHFYCIVQFRAVVEKVVAYELLLRDLKPFRNDRYRLRQRLDISILIRVASERFERWPGLMGSVLRFTVLLSMVIFPVGLLLVLQLQFLPFQDEITSWVHRSVIVLDVAIATWFWMFATVPHVPPRHQQSAPLFLSVWKLVLFLAVLVAVVIFSIVVACFPGEKIYAAFGDTWIRTRVTRLLLESNVDYVNRSVSRWFSNRLILIDQDPGGTKPLSLRGRHLQNAVLDRSNLRQFDFTAADLRGASLQGSKLTGAQFGCATPTFQDPMVEYDRDCAVLEHADFSFADLRESNFQNAYLSGSHFNFANLSSANFNGADFRGAVLSFAHGKLVDFSNAQLQASVFSGGQFRLANFSDAGLQGARLDGAYLQGADFYGAHLQAASLYEAHLQGASFKSAWLQSAMLDFASLQGASFAGAGLQSASLKCVHVYRTEVEKAVFDNAVLTNSASGCSSSGSWVTTTVTEYYSRTTIFDMKGDSVPEPVLGFGFTSQTPADADEDLEEPQKLSASDYDAMLARLTGDLPDEAKQRLRETLAALKPGTRSAEQDESDRKFWVDLAHNADLQDAYAKKLADRLISIACVEMGDSYVALGLLRASRFRDARSYGRTAIGELRTVALGRSNCAGAQGLTEKDFDSAQRETQ